jgi:hypothetical protein
VQKASHQRPLASLLPDLGLLPIDDADAVSSMPATASSASASGASVRTVSKRASRQKRTVDDSGQAPTGTPPVECVDGVCRIVPSAANGPPVIPSLDARSLTWHAAREELSRAGVTQFRLETWDAGRGYRFSCSVPSADNPYVSREFESRAASDMGAVAAVLEQIRQWQSPRTAAN